MLSIGPLEILLVLVVALVVLGPHRLPEAARGIARALHQLRAAAGDMSRDLGIDELGNDLREIEQSVQAAGDGTKS